MSRDPILSLPWPDARPLPDTFFDRDALLVARELLGKVIRHRQGNLWLAARIIETEAYYLEEKGSHASLGYTEKRKALFLDGGHIYMYYARGGDSLNFQRRRAGQCGADQVRPSLAGSHQRPHGAGADAEPEPGQPGPAPRDRPPVRRPDPAVQAPWG